MTRAAWDLVDSIWRQDRIDRHYGESVSQGEHMLQAAARARAADAPDALVVAALLHDVGHVVGPPGLTGDERDRDHAEIGVDVLRAVVPAAVTEPIRLHVAAKRYLVAVDADYARRLSPASVHTLALQGGPMSVAEQAAFEADPSHVDALRLRAWDEAAKVVGAAVAPLTAYRPLIESLAPPLPDLE